MELIGRSSELELLTGLLAQAADGTSAALAVRGEPGIGKTALLDAVAARAQADGMRLARVTGVESEAPLGYAALHRAPPLVPAADRGVASALARGAAVDLRTGGQSAT